MSRVNKPFSTSLIILVAGLAVALVWLSDCVRPASAQGSWSLGDRVETLDNRPSTGWHKVGFMSPSAFNAKNLTWNPAIVSTVAKTAVMWSPLNSNRVAGALWDRETGTWTSDQSFFSPPLPSGNVMSSPALLWRGGDLIDLVVLGSDQYYHAFYSGGKWSTWEPIGGMGGAPSMALNTGSPFKIDVFVIAKKRLWRQRFQQGSGWVGWKDIGQPSDADLITAPGATARSDNTIDVVAPSALGGQLYHAFFSADDKFSGWEQIPGKSFSQPAIVSPSPGRLDVWVRGASDNLLYHEIWTAGKWSPFEMTVNKTPPGKDFAIVTGPSANLSPAEITNIAGVTNKGDVVVRSWVAPVAAQQSGPPSAVHVRRPMKSPPAFVIEGSAENTIAIAPGCNAVYLNLGNSGDLQKQKMTCVLNGSGEKTEGAFKACDSQSSKSSLLFGSTDNQITVMKNGTVLLLRQGGGVKTATTRTGPGGRCRGVEHIFFASSCGTNWQGPVTLDPCDENGPFDKSFCNTDVGATPPCGDNTPLSGTDRPEILASRHDDSVYMAVGVAGATGKYNLVLLRSHESDLTQWKAMDTGMQSGGASSLAESPTHLYLARCEYGEPANVGLYAYRKNQPFVAKNLGFLGNIADASCSTGNVSISLMKSSSGLQVVRWVIPSLSGTKQFFKRGFSAVTPGGLVTLQSADFKDGLKIGLPTLIATDYNDRALLYWYELGNDVKWRVKGSVSDGIGRWSLPFALSTTSWPQMSQQPWPKIPTPGHDYMKGSQFKLDTKMKFLAQWVQPVAGNNEIFYGIVDW